MPAQEAFRANLFFDSPTGNTGFIDGVNNYELPEPEVNTVESTKLERENRLQQRRRVANSLGTSVGNIVVEYDGDDEIHRMMDAAIYNQTEHTIRRRLWATADTDAYTEQTWSVRFTGGPESSDPSQAYITKTYNLYGVLPVGPVWNLVYRLSLAASASKTYDLSKFCSGPGLTFTVADTTPSVSAFATAAISGNTLTVNGHASNTAATTVTVRAADSDGNVADTQLVVSLAS